MKKGWWPAAEVDIFRAADLYGVDGSCNTQIAMRRRAKQ